MGVSGPGVSWDLCPAVVARYRPAPAGPGPGTDGLCDVAVRLLTGARGGEGEHRGTSQYGARAVRMSSLRR